MDDYGRPRRLNIIVSDEETGEEVASAKGVETLVLLVAPDRQRGEDYRRILIGDPDLTVELLFEIIKSVTERIGQGTVVDLTDVLDDDLLLELTDGLPCH